MNNAPTARVVADLEPPSRGPTIARAHGVVDWGDGATTHGALFIIIPDFAWCSILVRDLRGRRAFITLPAEQTVRALRHFEISSSLIEGRVDLRPGRGGRVPDGRMTVGSDPRSPSSHAVVRIDSGPDQPGVQICLQRSALRAALAAI